MSDLPGNLVTSGRRDLAPIAEGNPLVLRGIADLAQGRLPPKLDVSSSTSEELLAKLRASVASMKQSNALLRALTHYNCGVDWLDQFADDEAVKEFDEAIRLIDEAIRLDPKNTEMVQLAHLERGKAWSGKCEALLENKHCRAMAIKDFDEAIRLEPKCASAYVERAEVWYRCCRFGRIGNDLSEAFRLIDEAIRLDPCNLNAFLDRAKALGRILPDQGRKLIDEIIRCDPKFLSSHEKRHLAFAFKDREEKINDYDQAILLHPHNARLYYLRGLARRREDTDKALKDFDQAIRLEPDHACLYFHRADLWDDNEKSINDYDQAIRLDPECGFFYDRRAKIRCERKDFRQAIRDFEQSILCDPEFPDAYMGLAWLLATCPDESIRDGKRAIQLAMRACTQAGPDWPHGWNVLAAAYAEAGQFDEAVRYQMKTLEDPYTTDDDYRQRLALYQQKKPFRQST